MKLLLIDIQGRLVQAFPESGSLLRANAGKLARAASLLDVPCVVTEQNPARLGSTVIELDPRSPVLSKMSFDASAAVSVHLSPMDTVVVAGCEAHICVYQTAIGLLKANHRVIVAGDAVASRQASDAAFALRRLAGLGVEIASMEMVIFEWLGSAEHPRFREVSALIKGRQPNA